MAKNTKFYDSYRWRCKTAPLVKQYNPQCQRIFDDGTQCGKPATVVHHLIDATEAPHIAHDWQNLVAVCEAHHAGGQKGETQGARYCATIAPMNSIYHHPGRVLPSWYKAYVKPGGDVSRLAGTSTSAVDGRLIDAALSLDINALLEGM